MTTLLAHEWLAPIGGSENVFEEIIHTFPESRKLCLWNDAPERFPEDIEETRLARTPVRRSKALALPFMSRAWRSVSLDGVDRVIVSSHAFAHHLAARSADAGVPSFAYVHTPARYVWAPEFDDRGQSAAARAGRNYFKRLDRKTTSGLVSYAANSEFVRDRIRQAWGQDAVVIYPPVDVERIQGTEDWRTQISSTEELAKIESLPSSFVLGASRLVEYKRLEAAIEVGEELDLPVVIAGRGPQEDQLRALAEDASIPVTFFGYASDEALYALYQAASLFVFMAIEDFGIMPVEAMALGTPVLVNDIGGAKESVLAVNGGVACSTAASRSEFAASAQYAIELSVHLQENAALAQFSTSSFSTNIAAWASAVRALGAGGAE